MALLQRGLLSRIFSSKTVSKTCYKPLHSFSLLDCQKNKTIPFQNHALAPRKNVFGVMLFGKRFLHISNIVGDPDKRKFSFMSEPRFLDVFGQHFQYSFSILAGHLSFVLLATSFVFHDIFWLRSLACGSGILTIIFTYYHPHGRVLWLPFGWNVLFVIINLTYIIHYIREDYMANHLRPDEEDLLNTVFDYTGISRVDFLKLVRAGTWEDYPVGYEITRSGTQNSRVALFQYVAHVIVKNNSNSSGKAVVRVKGEPVYVLEAGNFVGEMGLHVGLHISDSVSSSATVTVTEPMHCLVWSRGALIDILEQNSSLQRCMQACITADLMRKLKSEKVTPKHADEYSHLPVSEQIAHKSNLEYYNLLHYVLNKNNITAHEKNILKRYRTIHHIPDDVHTNYLREHGWKIHEFDHGFKDVPIIVEKQHIHSKTSHPFAG